MWNRLVAEMLAEAKQVAVGVLSQKRLLAGEAVRRLVPVFRCAAKRWVFGPSQLQEDLLDAVHLDLEVYPASERRF